MNSQTSANLDANRQSIPVTEIRGPTPQVWPTADLHEALHLILEQLDRLIDCDACAIWLLTNEIVCLTASRGLLEPAKAGSLLFDLQQYPDLWRLVHEGRPVVFRDVSEAGLFVSVAELGGMHAGITAPMLYHDRPIGLLLILKASPNYYSEQDTQSAMALASQAAMAIENARLYAETRRRTLQLEVASQVGQKVTAILEIDQLLPEVVQLIREKFGYDYAHLFLVDGHSREIVLRECSGPINESLKARGLRFRIGEQGITGWVAGTGEPVLCNDVSLEPRYHPNELLPNTQSELAIPLRVGAVVVGVLDVQSKQRGAFQDDDVIVLQIMADQIASAIENAHLFQSTRHQYEALRALHDISLEITAQLDSPIVLEAVLKQAAHLLRAQASSLAIYDPQLDVVHIIASYNFPPSYQGITLPAGEGAAGQAVKSGRAVVVNDYQNWPGKSAVFQDSPYDAILSVPMRWEGQVFGALNVMDRGERRPFTEDDVQLLSLFADLASIALKNAELYARLRQAGHELENKVEERTLELTLARAELAHQAHQLQRLLAITHRIQEEERTRIARDLHDGSNQLITGTLFEIQAAQQCIRGGHPEVALEKLETAKGLQRKIDAENRRIISGLRPPILDSQGLAPALKWHANTFQERYQITCSLQVSGQPQRLSPAAETAIYRIVQESLNNVAAHAQARKIQIRVDFGPARLRVVVEDDGVGFDYENALANAPGQMGLIGMNERARSIEGQIAIQSILGKGTRLALEVPVGEARKLEASPSVDSDAAVSKK